jgi:hypothetical protein
VEGSKWRACVSKFNKAEGRVEGSRWRACVSKFSKVEGSIEGRKQRACVGRFYTLHSIEALFYCVSIVYVSLFCI